MTDEDKETRETGNDPDRCVEATARHEEQVETEETMKEGNSRETKLGRQTDSLYLPFSPWSLPWSSLNVNSSRGFISYR